MGKPQARASTTQYFPIFLGLFATAKSSDRGWMVDQD